MSEATSSFKCNTCKACFASTEKIKEHYRSEWHVFNSKRRANGLMFLRKEDFKLLVSDKRVPSKSISLPTVSISDEVTTSNANDIDPTENEPVKTKTYEPKLGANVSIFDDKEFENVDDCVQYMALNFGFFIPDIEYLCNLEGFIKYLNEKVKVGGYCLYCQRQFQAGHPTQHHMLSKSHCKVAYENGVDGEEYEDFYDFSASYEDLDDADIELDEDGEVVEKKLEIARTGELVLPSGKVVGHRDFRVYYKQYYRPEETRTCVLAQQREELLRLGCKFSGEGASSLNDINELSDSEVMVKLVKFQKQVRRGMMVEQRAMQRAELIAQRREYKSTKDKLRASENTTAKIRDYHKLL
jgi:pre-60S factor REI1